MYLVSGQTDFYNCYKSYSHSPAPTKHLLVHKVRGSCKVWVSRGSSSWQSKKRGGHWGQGREGSRTQSTLPQTGYHVPLRGILESNASKASPSLSHKHTSLPLTHCCIVERRNSDNLSTSSRKLSRKWAGVKHGGHRGQFNIVSGNTSLKIKAGWSDASSVSTQLL